MTGRSIVEYFAEHEKYSCGYCKSDDTCYSHGMWAHNLTPADYQNLIDRGWRRSGKYCYKPTMTKICCPQYAIRCEVKRFTLSKSQKKVLKRVNKFLANGRNERNSPTPSDAADDLDMEISDAPAMSDIQLLKKISKVKDILKAEIDEDMTAIMNDTTSSKALNNEVAVDFALNSSKSENCNEDSSSQSQLNVAASASSQKLNNPDPSRPLCRKAKDIRKERRLQKLMAAGKTPEEINAIEMKRTSQPKNIEDFMLESLSTEQRHKLEFRLVPSDVENPLFLRTYQDSYEIYQKYQVVIHKDPPEKCTKKQYTRFLVNSPFQYYLNDDTYGSFHQQYWLNDKLIAVAVIDILPQCVSSVYFYYDPDYSFLSLGTYAALREIYFARELNKRYPSLQYYYMGFYIHSCVKMRYKGQYHPSYLLCPETYIFQEIESCKPKLDISKYHRLEEDLTKVDTDGAIDVNETLILFSGKAMIYPMYRLVSKNEHDQDVIREYAGFVGKKCYRRMLLYRS